MGEHTEALAGRLSRLFWAVTAVAAGLFGLDIVFHRAGIDVAVPFGTLRLWGIALLVLSVACGVALPILLRALFQTRAAERGKVTIEGYERLQVRIMLLVLAAALAADAAYLFPVPPLYLYGCVLAALYGIYSIIPSSRKIAGELRYYGLA